MYNTYWMVTTLSNGFKGVLFFYGKEKDLVPYLETEVKNYTSYCGATDKEIACAKAIGLPVYLI